MKPAPCRPCRDMTMAARSVRPFGRAADLDVSFEGADRPFLITALLAQCSDIADAEAWWREPTGSRIAALLRLATVSDGVETLTARLRCPRTACGSEFEIELRTSLLDDVPGPERVSVTLPDGSRALVRQPTGQDQRRWAGQHYTSQRDAITAIVDTLVVEGHVAADDERALAAVAAALADHDPLVDFVVSSACPSCEQPIETSIDLEGTALARLAAVRRSLLADVHALASAYGWTEREILAIPSGRRASYRALIDGPGR